MITIPTIFFAVFGALIGSFSGVVAERAYTGQSWKKGRSRCNSCREYLGVRDLVPVFSWVVSRGRCRHCGSSVPGAYALYEIVLALIFASAYLRFGISLALVLFLLAVIFLAFITLYDLRHTIVPQGAANAFILVAAFFAFVTAGTVSAFFVTLLVAIGIAVFFFILHVGSRGRAMGLGDTPISFGLSLLSGSAAIPGLLFSFWVGAVIGIAILVLRKGGPKMGIEVPFVPFMAIGFLLAIFTQWNPLPF